MTSKKFNILNAVLVVFGIAAFIYFQQAMKVEEMGGYKQGTEQYNGYRYAQDNRLQSVGQCEDDSEINIRPLS